VIARVTTFEGDPERMEEGARIFRDQVVPWLRDSTGFRGLIVLVDRENERAMGISFWTTKETATDAYTSGATLRDEVAASVGTTMTGEEFYEVVTAQALALDDDA
jgi:AraC-like DNA-binding protein